MTSTTPSRPLSTSSSFVLFGLIIARLVVAMVTINKNSYWKAGDGIKRKTLNWAPCSLKWDMEQLREKFEAVKASGDLIFFPSQIVNIQDKDIQFQFRVCPTVDYKVTSDKEQHSRIDQNTGLSFNPFLPYDQKMEVSELTRHTDHVILFNKFALVPKHLLVITRHYESQASSLTKDNFGATIEAMEIFDVGQGEWLAFYNRGKCSGASQHHRHLQLLPFGPNDDPIPLKNALPKDIGRSIIPTFSGFHHYFIRFNGNFSVQSLYDHYVEALNNLPKGCEDYNLLFTREWMLLVPRKSDASSGVAMNSLAFVGCIMMRGQEQLDSWLASVGTPLQGLLQLAFPIDTP